MPNLEFFLIAESVSVDQSTNRLSLFNILEELHAIDIPPNANLPGGIPQLVAASSWIIAPDELGRSFHVNLLLHASDRPEPLNLGTLEFMAERRRQRALQVVLGCPVPAPGEIRFEILLDGSHVANHMVSVSRAEIHSSDAADEISLGGKK